MSIKSVCLALLPLAVLCCSDCSLIPDAGITVSSGTQFSVDARDDAMIMDLQGMLWRLPAGGGEAAALTGPEDDMRRPRISPDGQWIVYQTFERGVWDIGMMRIDGSDRRLLTDNAHDDRDPEWSVDGESIWFASDRAGNYDIWSVDIETGILTCLTNDASDDYAPTASNSGLAFISARSGKPALYLHGDSETLKEIATSSAGRLHPPRFSPDGRYIAYARALARNAFPGMAVNQLVVQNLKTGDTRVVSPGGADVFSAAPAWIDAKTLLYTIDGRIRSVALDTGEKTVPFRATLPVSVSNLPPRLPIAFANDEQPALGIVDPVMGPDDSIIFNALGDLWSLAIGGMLTRFTDDEFVERDPHISPDGRQLVFISDRGGDMQIWIRDLEPGLSRQVTKRAGGPRYPTFSPDGEQLAYLRVGPRGTKDFTLRVIDLDSKKDSRLRNSPKVWPGRMAWSADGTHITVAELAVVSERFGDGANRLVRVDVAADTASVELLTDNADHTLVPDFGPVASPDGRQLAIVIDGALWRVAVAADGRVTGSPVLVLDELVESPAFSRDGRHIAALTNRGLETINLDTGERATRNPPLTWSPAIDTGLRVVRAGRLFDGETESYINDVDIVIDGARIVAVEPHRERAAGIRVIDASDKTIMPGLVDHHVHFEPHNGEWVGRAWLSFGVTTVVEPGGLPYESREIMEAWSSGRRAGPRLVFAGPQLDGSRRHFHFASHINSDRRLDWELDRAERLRYGLIKTYTRMAPSRQKLSVELAHAHGLPITAHAAFRNLSFGGNRIEHLRGSSRLSYSPKQSELLNSYEDVTEIIARTGSTVTPTISVAGGFFDYALKHPEIFKNPQYTTFWPKQYRQGLESFTRVVGKNRELIGMGLANAKKTVALLHERGVPIVAGTDSPIFPYGLTLVIELANYVDAGLTPAEALKTATASAAAALGAEQDVGRIKSGRLADLVIIDGDPLNDVTDLLNVSGVMKNGRYFMISDLLMP